MKPGELSQAIVDVAHAQEDQVLHELLMMLRSGFMGDIALGIACAGLRQQMRRIEHVEAQGGDTNFLDSLKIRLENHKAQIGAVVGTDKLEKALNEEE